MQSHFSLPPGQSLALKRFQRELQQRAINHPTSVNHLYRVLKVTTGKTTGEIIGSRISQEAKILLAQTQWNISEIAFSLGFAWIYQQFTFEMNEQRYKELKYLKNKK